MQKPLSLRKNFSWTFVGSVISTGCQWLMLILITKFLTVEEVGYYSLALAITSPLVLFSMLQLRTVELTDTQGKYSFGDYLGLRLLTNIIALCILIAILLALAGRYEIAAYLTILLMFINKSIEAVSDICYGVMQKHERLDKVSRSLIYRNVGAVVILYLMLLLTNNLMFGLIGIGLWWLFLLFAYDQRNVSFFESCSPVLKFRRIYKIFKISAPLGVSRGMISLNESVPRYFIEGYLGTASLAIFTPMAYTVTGAYRCIEALGYSAAAKLAKYFINNRKGYLKLLVMLIIIAALLGAGLIIIGIFFGEHILRLLYTETYAEKPSVFVWLLVVAAFKMISSMLNHGLNATRRFKVQVPLNIISVVFCFVFSIFSIPRYGIKGAAWAILVSILVKIIGSLLVICLALKKSKTHALEKI